MTYYLSSEPKVPAPSGSLVPISATFLGPRQSRISLKSSLIYYTCSSLLLVPLPLLALCSPQHSSQREPITTHIGLRPFFSRHPLGSSRPQIQSPSPSNGLQGPLRSPATSAPACSCPHSAPATVASQLSKPAHHANTPGPLQQPFLGLTCSCTPTPTEHMAHLSPTSSACPQINFSARPPPISLFTNTAAPAPSHSLSSPHPTLLSPTYT